jgi:signal recognition particle subunit SRP54
MKMMPEQLTGGMSLTDEQSEQVEAQMKRTEAIIDSMTKQERQNYKILDASRKTRIAKGSGSTIAEVNQLIRQYEQMRKMMQQMNRGGLFSKLARGAMGGMGGGLGGLLGGGMPGGGLGGLFGGGGEQEEFDNEYEETRNDLAKRLKKKKRHKKRR